MPRLENWSVVSPHNSRFVEPHAGLIALKGIVFGHADPRHPDGSQTLTSPINRKDGELVFTITDTGYELGEVDPAYEAEYPGAKEKLLAALPLVQAAEFAPHP